MFLAGMRPTSKLLFWRAPSPGMKLEGTRVARCQRPTQQNNANCLRQHTYLPRCLTLGTCCPANFAVGFFRDGLHALAVDPWRSSTKIPQILTPENRKGSSPIHKEAPQNSWLHRLNVNKSGRSWCAEKNMLPTRIQGAGSTCGSHLCPEGPSLSPGRANSDLQASFWKTPKVTKNEGCFKSMLSESEGCKPLIRTVRDDSKG